MTHGQVCQREGIRLANIVRVPGRIGGRRYTTKRHQPGTRACFGTTTQRDQNRIDLCGSIFCFLLWSIFRVERPTAELTIHAERSLEVESEHPPLQLGDDLSCARSPSVHLRGSSEGRDRHHGETDCADQPNY